MPEPIRIRIAEITYPSGCQTGQRNNAVPYRVKDSVTISQEALQKYEAQNGRKLEKPPVGEQTGHTKQEQRGQKVDPAVKKSLGALDLGPNAGPEDIKRAYREAVKKYHPDRFQSSSVEQVKAAEEKIKQINSAYSFLKKV